MDIEKEDILAKISKIREEIGHEDLKPDITEIFYDEKESKLLIITSDRPEKSLVIGKGGWVVGKLKEDLKIDQIHVEAYPDIMLRKYRMELALKKLEQVETHYKSESGEPLTNLHDLLEKRMEHPYNLADILVEKKASSFHQGVVALSGGVDSTFALAVAKVMGFNPLAVTVNPGDIILPKHFRERIEKLTRKLSVEHRYLEVDLSYVVEGALEGRYHPCGRCSKVIEDTVLEFTQENKIPFMIFGDLLATGAQSLVYKGDVLRINLPAMLSASKGETKALARRYDVYPAGGYGCPLLAEVKKRYSYMNRFSLQRILRETRAGILEPGEALGMVMSLCKNQ